jgi:hypothetical protein
MEPVHLQEDLKQDVICIVCEWPDEKVIKLHRDNALEFYVVRVILNQVKSNTSDFTKKYRQQLVEINESYTDFYSNTSDRETRKGEGANKSIQNMYDRKYTKLHDFELEDQRLREFREKLEDLTLNEINSLYWYDAEMIRLYLKLGSFRAIQDNTGIPFISCYKNIQKSLLILKSKADGHSKQLFSKQERSFIQNNKTCLVT